MRITRVEVLFVAALASACQASAVEGTRCERNAECPSPLVCRLGRCRTECATQRDCPAGAECLLDVDGQGACSLAVDVCTETSECGGLACIDGRCVDPCTNVSECAPGSTCEAVSGGRSRCARIDVDAGMPTTDAGAGVCAHHFHATAIASGVDQSCVIRDDGTVVCWGLGTSGELGDGEMARADHDHCGADDCSPRAVGVIGPSDQMLHATLVAAGPRASCALETPSGAVVCWGAAALRGDQPGTALGHATYVVDELGARIDGATSAVIQIVFGATTVYALHADGSVQGWGMATVDELGAETAPHHAVPELVTSGTNTITAGTGFACVASAGVVRCIGEANNGVFGTAVDPEVTSPMAVTVSELAGVGVIAAGAMHLCTAARGIISCLGDDDTEQLGNSVPGVSCGCSQLAVFPAGVIEHLTDLIDVASSSAALFTCARNATDVFCWGSNSHGESGTTASQVTNPVAVAGLMGTPMALGVGARHACAIVGDHSVRCWGANDLGQLGSGAIDAMPHPIAADTCLDLPGE